MFRKRPTVLALASLAGSLAVAASASAATDPAVACASNYAKAVGKCVKKAISVQASCVKSSGSLCLSTDDKLAKAYSSAAKGVRGKCENDAAVYAAGYGPQNQGTRGPLNLGNFGGDQCKYVADAAAKRILGGSAGNYAAADADGKKELLNAAKNTGKVLGAAIGSLSKCVADGCTFDFSTQQADLVALYDDKSPNLATLAGSSSADLASAAMDQVPEAVASPCDPIDGSRCAFPFPNDYFTVSDDSQASGRHLSLGRAALPVNDLDAAVNPTRFNEADGFSIGAMILFSDPNIDLTQTGAPPITDMAQSLDPGSPVLLIDADSGDKQLIWVERDQRGATAADQPIIIRVGRNLEEGHRYIVALRNMKDAMGATLSAPASFALYRDNTPSTSLPVEARREHMEDVLDRLEGAGITRSSLYMAWDFTTQSSSSTSKRLLAMRDDADTTLGAGTPAFTVTSTVDNPDAEIYRQVDGTFQVPLYLKDRDTGAPSGAPGTMLNTDADGTPVATGQYFTASFRCMIPASANNSGVANPARPSLYGHGLLGSHTEVGAGNVRDMANEHNFVFCATDWTGFADDDSLFVLDVLRDFTNFSYFIDRQHQGMLNMMFLGKLMLNAAGFASDPAFQIGGQSVIDATALFYDGNSQGGILGGVLAAFEKDLTRMVLGVPGMNYSTLLNRSTDFEDFDSLLEGHYPSSTDRNLLLSFAQLYWDRTDPNGHIHHVIADPYDNTPVKSLLYQVAFGDHQVAPVTVEVAARSNGMSIHTPILATAKNPDVTPYYDIPAIPSYPFEGSAMVIWDSGNPAPPLGNTSPTEITPAMTAAWAALGACPQAHGSDPHSCPRSNPDARTQKSEFLKASGGAVVDVCGGAACWAN